MYNSKIKNEKYRIPVFDRIIDSNPLSLKLCDREELKNYIKINLENLLNTRAFKICDTESTQKDKTDKNAALPLNVLDYGLRDYSVLDLSQNVEYEKFTNEVKDLIESFEPRLKNVSIVAIQNGNSAQNNVIRFKIIGTLDIGDLDTEDISFNTNIFPHKKIIHIEK